MEASRPLIEQAGHAVEVAIPSDPIELDADPIRIAQVLSNLLNNAAKYTHPGGKITLRAARVNSEIEIAVEDNGIGMPPESIAKLFDIFAQSASASHLSRGGLGIGLFLVKSLTEMHGGSVSAHSEGPARGAVSPSACPHRLGTGGGPARCAGGWIRRPPHQAGAG